MLSDALSLTKSDTTAADVRLKLGDSLTVFCTDNHIIICFTILNLFLHSIVVYVVYLHISFHLVSYILLHHRDTRCILVYPTHSRIH